MKKKWIVIPSLLLLTALAALATMPIWRSFWEEHRPGPKLVVDSAMRREAIATLAAKLDDHYVFPDKARQIGTVLRQREHEGKYDGITDGKQLAIQLTKDLRGIAHDKHMMVAFSRSAIRLDDAGQPPTSKAEWDQRANLVQRLVVPVMAGRRVEKVDRLSPNIGYLKLSGFPPAFLMTEKFAAAMNELADTEGLIVDLRDNGGGAPESVALLVSYFVDGRTRLNDTWDRDTGLTTQQWTQDKLDGKRYGGRKPVLILAGPGTRSAGEDFAYTMQAMKRATVVGEPTWGGAHPTRPHRLGTHFLALIPGRRSINPITNTNWEGTGVIPDIAARPDDALAVARALLQRRLDASGPLAAAGP
jgi:C-terminal processing protease CtpA/Prc